MDKYIDTISDIRDFNRFYTQILGLLDKHILDSGYSLTEARILFEISKNEECTANAVISKLAIDASYMSRIIAKFQRDNILSKKVSQTDSRAKCIKLTEYGRSVIAELNKKSNEQINNLLVPLSIEECEQISEAMKTIKKHFSFSISETAY